MSNTKTKTKLPPLDNFSREELVQLIGILHGALETASEQFDALHATTKQAIAIAQAATA